MASFLFSDTLSPLWAQLLIIPKNSLIIIFSFSNPLIINKDLTVTRNGSISDYQLQLSIKLNVNLQTKVTFSNANFLTHI